MSADRQEWGDVRHVRTETDLVAQGGGDGSGRWRGLLPQWVPTSMKAVADAERRVLRGVKAVLRGRFVPVRLGGDGRVWTISTQPQSAEVARRCPIVLVHGFAGGSAIWLRNLDALSASRPVHAFDLIGFGRSSRPTFSGDAEIVELEWTQSIEDWRRAVGIDKMILLGHSLGGYLATAYALEHPERVRHLVLIDPWGFPRRGDGDRELKLPTWARTLGSLLSYFNPLASVRAAGPWGKSLVRRVRPDFGRRFGSDDGDDTTAIYDYIYHCNAQTPSGETAFRTLTIPFGWAKRPMVERLAQVSADVPVTFLYGSKSWIEPTPGYEMQQSLRRDTYVDVQVVPDAGHHVYVDNADDFNAAVVHVCALVDADADVVA